MPLEQHPTDPDKLRYASRHYDIPQLQGVTTTQRPWVGLTVEEIEEIGKPYEEKDRSMQAWGLFACAIEAALRSKNT
jgi:hypothetical protein